VNHLLDDDGRPSGYSVPLTSVENIPVGDDE
jgi:hypothetical protein